MTTQNGFPTFEQFWEGLPPLADIYSDFFYTTHSKSHAECCGYLPHYRQYLGNRANNFVCYTCDKNTFATLPLLSTHVGTNQQAKKYLYTGCMLTVFPEMFETMKAATIAKQILRVGNVYKKAPLIGEIRANRAAWLQFCALIEGYKHGK